MVKYQWVKLFFPQSECPDILFVNLFNAVVECTYVGSIVTRYTYVHTYVVLKGCPNHFTESDTAKAGQVPG